MILRFVTAASVCLLAAATGIAREVPAGPDWPVHGGDPGHTLAFALP